MSNQNIKPGEMEDIVPEEVSAVDTPAVIEAEFVVLNKSETPEPESTEEILEVLEKAAPECEIEKAIAVLKAGIASFSPIQKAAIVDLALAVAPEESEVEKSSGECKKEAMPCDGEDKKEPEEEEEVKPGLSAQISKMCDLMEKILEKQAVTASVEHPKEEIVRKEASSAAERAFSQRVEFLAGQVAQLTSKLGRACGQDT